MRKPGGLAEVRNVDSRKLGRLANLARILEIVRGGVICGVPRRGTGVPDGLRRAAMMISGFPPTNLLSVFGPPGIQYLNKNPRQRLTRVFEGRGLVGALILSLRTGEDA